LCKAPATEREFNVLRTALLLTFGFALRVAFPVELSSVLWPTASFVVLRTAEERLVRELVDADERVADERVAEVRDRETDERDTDARGADARGADARDIAGLALT